MALQRSLLALPAEIRIKIWTLCVQSSDDSVTMCPCEARPSCKHTFNSCTAVYQDNRRSCESDYSQHAFYQTDLNLFFVNEQIRDEVQYLYSSKLLKFCSRLCFADLLRTIGPHYDWVKRIEISMDLRPLKVGYSYSSARYQEMLHEEKILLCEVASQHFGSCLFEGKEIWNGFGVTGVTRHEFIVSGTLDSHCRSANGV